MTRPQAESWSTARSLAFLAAIFAIVLGTLMPFAAMAAVVPGQTLVICSTEGPRTIQSRIDGDQDHHVVADAKCAACVTPVVADLPPPPRLQTVRSAAPIPQSAFVPRDITVPPPARAPPRPWSTAPPLA